MVPMPTLCGKINCKHFYEIIPFFLSCRGPGADVPGPLDTAGFYSVQYSSHFPGFPLRSTGPRGDNTMYEPSTQLNQSAVPIVTLLHLSWPAILEQLLLTAANYVDTAMVGSLGAGATASVAINSSVCFLLMGLFAAAGVGYSVQVAHALGGQDLFRARTAVHQAASGALLMGTGAAVCMLPLLYGDNVIEKHGINRDSTGDREKTRYLCGKQGIFTRDRALIRPGFIRQLETRASTRSASFFHALGSPGRPHNGGGEAGAYRTRNGAKPLKQGHLRAKRGPLGPSRKSQQQTKRTGFAAHGHSIAETAPEGKRASCANGALIRA